MPRASIDYLNARRECRAASGGKTYAVKRNAVDDKAQFADLDIWEQTMMQVDAILADFRSWANNRPPVAAIAGGQDDDWF
jgi:hypothetical protein